MFEFFNFLHLKTMEITYSGNFEKLEAMKNCLFNFWNHGKLSVDLSQIVQILQSLIDLASYEISIDLTFQVN